MNYCHVSAQIDRHLDEEAKSAARQEAILERASAIQRPGAEYDPLDADNFGEAMAGADFSQVVALYREGDDLAAGVALRKIAERHCQQRAEDAAEELLEADIKRAEEDAAAEAYEWRRHGANH